MTKTILTIDDSASIRQMVAMTLTGAGLDVLEAGNGQEGYDVATANTVHAILTDLNMPVLNGIEFIRKYRQHPSSKGVPIILLTTESDDPSKEVRQTTIDVRGMADVELAKVLATIADREEVIDIDHAPGNGS